jgi:hypothetical protein
MSIALIALNMKEGKQMARENVLVKSVHFNKKNPDDNLMIKEIGKKTFSKYVKQLIKEDMERKKEPKKRLFKESGGIKFTLK